jgi:hypothetical protein
MAYPARKRKRRHGLPDVFVAATRQGSREEMTGFGRQQLRTPEGNPSEFALMFCRLLPIPCSDGRCREGSPGNGRPAGDAAAAAVPSGIAVPTMHGLLAAGAGRDAPSRGAGATAMGQWHRPAAPERSPGAPTPAPCDGHQPGRAGGIRGALHPAPQAPAMAITPSGSCCADGRRRATRTTQWGAACLPARTQYARLAGAPARGGPARGALHGAARTAPRGSTRVVLGERFGSGGASGSPPEGLHGSCGRERAGSGG